MRSTQSTPFSTERASFHDRPRPSGRRCGRNNGSRVAHWASVRSMHMVSLRLTPKSISSMLVPAYCDL